MKTIITEDYVSFEVAELLKEKGFDEPCHATYDTAVTGGKPKFSEYEVLSFFPYGMKNTDDKYNMIISAPTLSMAMKWLRDFHKIYIDISTTYSEVEKTMHYIWQIFNSEYDGIGDCEIFYGKYEDACEASVKYCLENLETLI